MHTARRVSDTAWEVGYFRPPIQGANYYVWVGLVVFTDARHAAAAVSALNGGGSDAAFSEASWQQMKAATIPVATPVAEGKPAK